MKEALKYALLGLGAWWLLKDYFSATPTQPATAAPSPAQSQQPIPTSPAPTPGAPIAPFIPIEQLILQASANPAAAAAVADVRLTSDQWNYYNAQATGKQTTIDLFTPGNRGELIDAAEYWRRRQAAGLSGLRFWRA